MRKLSIIFVLLIFIFGCKEKPKYPYRITDFRPKLQENLTRINYYNEESNPLINPFITDSCSKTELIKLSQCDNPYIRINAIFALIERKDTNSFCLLLNHLDDTARIDWWPIVDVHANEYISDIMLEKLAFKLTTSQKDIIVERVLTNHLYLRSAIWIVEQTKPQEKYHAIIKKLVETKSNDCPNRGIILGLSKFKRQEDLPLIKKTLLKYINDDPSCNFFTFKSIESFPDTALFSILNEFYNTSIKKYENFSFDLENYCKAIAIYKNQTSLNLLTTLTEKRSNLDSNYYQFYLECIFKSIHKYNSPLYSDLYNKLIIKMRPAVLDNLNKTEYEVTNCW